MVGEYEERSIEETLDLGWKVLTALPRAELYRVTEAEIEKHYEAALADGPKQADDAPEE